MLQGLPFLSFITELWGAVTGLISTVGGAISTLMSYTGIMPQIASILPGGIMSVICAMFLVTILLECLKALLSKV